MGLVYNTYLNSDKIFGCKNCKTHLASHDAIISRVRLLAHMDFFFLSTLYSRLNYIPAFHPMLLSLQSTSLQGRRADFHI